MQKSFLPIVWVACFLLLVGMASSCKDDKVVGTATILYEQEDGGVFYLLDARGTRYYPLNLSEEFHYNGLRVLLEARVRRDTTITAHNGIPLEILQIRPMLLSTKGHIQKVDSLGGFYGIVDEIGQQYMPFHLDALFELDQLPVQFAAKLRLDTTTTPPWGTPIELVNLAPAFSSDEHIGTGHIQAEENANESTYTIVDQVGRRLAPSNLPPSFQRDQLLVRFGYTIEPPDSTDNATSGRIALRFIEQGDSEAEFARRGLIRRVNLEVGFFGLIDEEGHHYQPLHLDEAFQKDGMTVHFWAIADSTNITMQMWGTPIQVTRIEDEESSDRYQQGTITYLDLEGGFYGIVDEAGTRYRPLNLPEAYQQDGLTVRFSFVRRTNTVSIQMWGTAIDLLFIEARE